MFGTPVKVSQASHSVFGSCLKPAIDGVIGGFVEPWIGSGSSKLLNRPCQPKTSKNLQWCRLAGKRAKEATLSSGWYDFLRCEEKIWKEAGWTDGRMEWIFFQDERGLEFHKSKGGGTFTLLLSCFTSQTLPGHCTGWPIWLITRFCWQKNKKIYQSTKSLYYKNITMGVEVSIRLSAKHFRFMLLPPPPTVWFAEHFKQNSLNEMESQSPLNRTFMSTM